MSEEVASQNRPHKFGTTYINLTEGLFEEGTFIVLRQMRNPCKNMAPMVKDFSNILEEFSCWL